VKAWISVLASPLKPAASASVRAHGEGFAFGTSALANPQATVNKKIDIAMEREGRCLGAGIAETEQVTGLAS
jgi:hypothetical protein